MSERKPKETRTDGHRITVGLPRTLCPSAYEAKATRLYVIGRDNADGCKVGISSHPKRRLSSLQVSTPAKLSLFFQFHPASQSARSIESSVLQLLRPWKERGEWLNCHPIVAQKTAEAIEVGQDISPFLHLLEERPRRWTLAKEAQGRNPGKYEDDATKAAFAFYFENERACWESRIDIMRIIDPWGAYCYDPEDKGYQIRQAELARPKRRKTVLSPRSPAPSAIGGAR